MVTWYNGHVTNKKSYIFTFASIMTTKLDKVMAYGIGPRYTKSHDYLILWSYVVSWQNKKRTHQTYGHQMDTKLEEVVAYYMGLTLKMSHHS